MNASARDAIARSLRSPARQRALAVTDIAEQRALDSAIDAARGLPVTRLGEIRRPRPVHLVDAQTVVDAPLEREPERTLRRSYRSSAT